MRSLLLAGSDSMWLRQRAPELPFVRKAVRRFMPGERLEDALAAAAELGRHGIGAVLTQLGEDVSDLAKADEVGLHYTKVLAAARAAGLDCHISVKLSQLGLDLDFARCQAHLRALAGHAGEMETFVWIDMEQHTRVDATLEIYRRLQPEFHNVGVCLQRGEGYRVRVLISYGEEWFPWYMRRLAERPANVLFAAKSMFSN